MKKNRKYPKRKKDTKSKEPKISPSPKRRSVWPHEARRPSHKAQSTKTVT